jgi:hypothetical protein
VSRRTDEDTTALRVVATPAASPASGRERHDEKITVYLSRAELLDIERARLELRGEHSLAVDRGRIVRAAVAMALAEFATSGSSSDLLARLRTT